MTADRVDTVEDLVRILDERPEWLEALRTRLLTRELLETPQRMAELTQRVDALTQRVDVLTQRMDELAQRMDQLAQRVDMLTQRMDVLTQRMDALTQRVDELSQRLTEFIEAANQRFERIERRLDRLTDNVGNLKGAHAKSVAKEEADIIAEGMGLRLTRLLTGQEVGELAKGQEVSDIPRNELLSFRRADIVMEAADADGAPCYVAVEVSYTVNGRDTSRAVRNADMLTRFTGKPARAAVAGLQIDDRVRGDVESGVVFWHEMVEDDVQAD